MPPCAASNTPAFDSTAPVNAPRTWPNSSLSNSVSTTAEQLIVTNGLLRRGARVMERARRQLLAGAGLAADQHDLGVRRQPLDEAEHLLHHRTAAEHAAELELPRHLALERDDLRAPLELRADVARAPAAGDRSRTAW